MSQISKTQEDYLRELKYQFQVAQEERNLLASKMKQLNESERGLTQRRASLKKEVQFLTGPFGELRTVLFGLEDERNSMAAEYEVTRTLLRTLQVSHEEQLQRMLKERKTFQNTLGDPEEQRSGLVRAKESDEEEAKQLRSRVSGNQKVDEEKRHLEASLERVTEERDFLRMQATQLTDELVAKTKELEAKVELESQLSRLTKKYEEKTRALRDKWGVESRDHISQIEHLTVEL